MEGDKFQFDPLCLVNSEPNKIPHYPPEAFTIDITALAHTFLGIYQPIAESSFYEIIEWRALNYVQDIVNTQFHQVC